MTSNKKKDLLKAAFESLRRMPQDEFNKQLAEHSSSTIAQTVAYGKLLDGNALESTSAGSFGAPELATLYGSTDLSVKVLGNLGETLLSGALGVDLFPATSGVTLGGNILYSTCSTLGQQNPLLTMPNGPMKFFGTTSTAGTTSFALGDDKDTWPKAA